MQRDYDIYYYETGSTRHVTTYSISDAYATSYTMLASIAIPTYVNKAVSSVEKFNNPTDFYSSIINSPGRVI